MKTKIKKIVKLLCISIAGTIALFFILTSIEIFKLYLGGSFVATIYVANLGVLAVILFLYGLWFAYKWSIS